MHLKLLQITSAVLTMFTAATVSEGVMHYTLLILSPLLIIIIKRNI